MACSVVRAARDPASTLGSIWVRRAETRANSEPTKKAFAARSASATRMAVRSLIRPLLQHVEADLVDAQAVTPLHQQLHGARGPLLPVTGEPGGDHHLGALALLRYVAELAQDEA